MISVVNNQNSVSIRIAADIINTSSKKFNLHTVKKSIEQQLLNVYHASVGKYNLDFSININVLSKTNQCSLQKSIVSNCGYDCRY